METLSFSTSLEWLKYLISNILTLQSFLLQNGSNLPATQRAYHVDEVKANKELSIDKKFYLAQQIYPVVSRLCDPIEGTDAAKIAECLGKYCLLAKMVFIYF